MSQIDKSTKTGSKLVVARDGGRGKWGMTASRYGVSLRGRGNDNKMWN